MFANQSKLMMCLAVLLQGTFFLDHCQSQVSKSTDAEHPERNSQDWVYLENEQVRIGLLRSHGGALGHLSKKGETANLLNHHDHGRLVQQSYYGDEDGSKWSVQPWRYNPVQGGDYQGKAAKMVEFQSNNTTASVKTVPRHWANGRELNECLMEQQVTLDGALVHVHYRFKYDGDKSHQGRHQELPAVFVDDKLKHLVYYQGDYPWMQQPTTKRIPGWPNEYIKIHEGWVAYLNDEGFGVGIYVPGVEEATCYRFSGKGSAACSYVAPIKTFAIEPGLQYEYDAYLTVGNVDSIRSRFEELHAARRRP